MKFVIAIPDGAADMLSAYPEGKTPLSMADTPMMDELANHGEVGWAETVPKTLSPGSDVACLSIFGYNPQEMYSGRAPLEAASMGIDLRNRVAFRCNLVTIEKGVMKEFTAGHISTKEAAALINSLNEQCHEDGVDFHTGVQYRHVMTAQEEDGEVECIPPHDITDQEVEPYWPKGKAQEKIRWLMERSREIFLKHPVNENRRMHAKPLATHIWLWGQGKQPQIGSYEERYGLSGGVISAVDLIKGIGTLAGLDVVEVEGATGLMDTNYEGKADAALDLLYSKDFVCVHVEAPDEMGHKGDAGKKSQALADFDQRMLRRLVNGLQRRKEEFRMLVLPDHPTPISLKTHVNEPVPYILYDSRYSYQRSRTGYSEMAVMKRNKQLIPGYRLVDLLCERANVSDLVLE